MSTGVIGRILSITGLATQIIAPAAFSSSTIAATPSLSIPQQNSARAAHLSPLQTAERIADHVIAQGDLPKEIASQLKMEALLALYDVSGKQQYLVFVQDNFKKLNDSMGLDPTSRMFSNISFELVRREPEPRDFTAFEAQARSDEKNVTRAYDGAVSFFRDENAVMKRPDGNVYLTREMAPIFVDHLSAYAPRMAMVGQLTGDDRFGKEAVKQIMLFRAALRDPQTGLWNHGRGWYGSAQNVTAVKWGRAQGWVLRALVETMTYLPPNSSEFRQLSGVLRETAEALRRYQDKEGFWHQVADRPESFAETSSTGLISYYFARAIHQGYLPRKGFAETSRKAFGALAKNRISASGVVYGASMSTPPLPSIEQYLIRPTPADDPHGIGTAIFAAVGQKLLEIPANSAR